MVVMRVLPLLEVMVPWVLARLAVSFPWSSCMFMWVLVAVMWSFPSPRFMVLDPLDTVMWSFPFPVVIRLLPWLDVMVSDSVPECMVSSPSWRSMMIGMFVPDRFMVSFWLVVAKFDSRVLMWVWVIVWVYENLMVSMELVVKKFWIWVMVWLVVVLFIRRWLSWVANVMSCRGMSGSSRWSVPCVSSMVMWLLCVVWCLVLVISM